MGALHRCCDPRTSGTGPVDADRGIYSCLRALAASSSSRPLAALGSAPIIPPSTVAGCDADHKKAFLGFGVAPLPIRDTKSPGRHQTLTPRSLARVSLV